jgi:DNA replication licensing factor MCM2
MPISELVTMEAPTIMREFKDFLLTYVDEHGTSVYGERIKTMCERKSLKIVFFL